MTHAVLEPCPPDAPMNGDMPEYGGRLFYNPDTGLSGCLNCGWSGVPTVTGGQPQAIRVHSRRRRLMLVQAGPEPPIISTRCPVCESQIDADVRDVDRERRAMFAHELRRVESRPRVSRNQPCPCGSGVKAKRCDCVEYAV